MDSAPAGSDLQLQYVRSFATFAFSPAQTARIKAILDGAISGLTVDANLRWHLLNSLVERGAATVADTAPDTKIDGYWMGLAKRSFQVA